MPRLQARRTTLVPDRTRQILETRRLFNGSPRSTSTSTPTTASSSATSARRSSVTSTARAVAIRRRAAPTPTWRCRCPGADPGGAEPRRHAALYRQSSSSASCRSMAVWLHLVQLQSCRSRLGQQVRYRAPFYDPYSLGDFENIPEAASAVSWPVARCSIPARSPTTRAPALASTRRCARWSATACRPADRLLLGARQPCPRWPDVEDNILDNTKKFTGTEFSSSDPFSGRITWETDATGDGLRINRGYAPERAKNFYGAAGTPCAGGKKGVGASPSSAPRPRRATGASICAIAGTPRSCPAWWSTPACAGDARAVRHRRHPPHVPVGQRRAADLGSLRLQPPRTVQGLRQLWALHRRCPWISTTASSAKKASAWPGLRQQLSPPRPDRRRGQPPRASAREHRRRPCSLIEPRLSGGEYGPVAPGLWGQYIDELVAGCSTTSAGIRCSARSTPIAGWGRWSKTSRSMAAITTSSATPASLPDAGIVQQLEQEAASAAQASMAKPTDPALAQAATFARRDWERLQGDGAVPDAQARLSRRHADRQQAAIESLFDLASYTYSRLTGNYPDRFRPTSTSWIPTSRRSTTSST